MGIFDPKLDLTNALPKQTKFKPAINPDVVLRGFGLQALKKKLYQTEDQEIDSKAPVATSYLGTPVFTNIEFEPGSFIDKDGNTIEYGNILQNNTDAETFQINTVLIDVTQQKQVIKTNIQGVAGTIKEYIAMGDYEIKMRGALVEKGQVYPEDQVLQLKEYLEVPASLAIISRFLNDIFKVDNIVIESYAFPQSEGFENLQLFEITAVSDDPIELTVINK